MRNDRATRVLISPELEEPLEMIGYDFAPIALQGLSRRAFVQILGAGILICAATQTGIAQTRPEQNRRGGGGGRGGEGGLGGRPVELGARLHIAKDGTITLLCGKVEGGQGSRAELTAAAAEELGVGVEQISLILADTALVPDDGITAGSATTPRTIPSVRAACATARKLLADFASQSPAAKKLTYADLAADEKFLAASKQMVGVNATVTAVDQWKVLGTAVARPNARDLVTGVHQYPSDQIRPGMLYGKILRQPSFGAKLLSVDLSAAKAMDGVIAVQDGQFVAVAASTTYLAKRALQAVAATAQWQPAPHPSSKTLSDYFRAHAGPIPEYPFADQVTAAAKVLKATYEVPYVQHAPLEPRAALAEWSEGNLTVWTGTQNPFGVRRELATAFGIAPEKVRVIVPDFGAAFGGKHTGECAVEAAKLAQAAKKPVTVRWTRPEEFTWAYFRPAALIDLQATLDKTGAITSWRSIDINYGPPGIDPPYRTQNHTSQVLQADPPLRHGSYRALAATANNFARESFMDELADAAGKDPLEFRLAHLDNDRLRTVLQTAAEKFDFTARRIKRDQNNIGVGLACATEKGSNVAACVEVEIDPATHIVTVRHICQAFECGAVMNPSNLTSQIQGALVQDLGPALREASEFEGGRITNASFYSYKVPRFSDLPKLDIHLVNRPDIPSAGAGETPLIALAPAIANAVFHATGTRVRHMPIKLPTTV